MYWVFSVTALSGTEIWIWGVPHQGISPEILWPSQDCTRVNTCANQTVPLRHSISRSWDTLAILGQSVLEWHIHTAHRLSEYPEILKYSDDPRTVPRWSGYLKILGYSDKGINAVFSSKMLPWQLLVTMYILRMAWGHWTCVNNTWIASPLLITIDKWMSGSSLTDKCFCLRSFTIKSSLIIKLRHSAK